MISGVVIESGNCFMLNFIQKTLINNQTESLTGTAVRQAAILPTLQPNIHPKITFKALKFVGCACYGRNNTIIQFAL